MGLATGTAGDQARQQHRQVVNTIRKQVNWNDAGIGAANGVTFAQLPIGAFITKVMIEIVVAFNAGTTNVLTVGTDAPPSNVIAAADVNEGAVGVTEVTRSYGRSLTAAAVTTLSAKFAQTGGAATAGQAEIVIEYEGNTG